MTTVMPVKIQTDGNECGMKCPFLRQDPEAGVLQCALFVEVLKYELEEQHIIPLNPSEVNVPVHIYRCSPCESMVSL
jgi:hypothetical protein